MRDILVIDGKSLSDFGVYLTDAGVYNSPRRKVDSVSIPGRNGNLFFENDNFENVKIKYPALIVDNYDVNFTALKDFLLSKKGYHRLEDTFHPNEYRLGVYYESLEPKTTNGHKMGSFQLVFDCKPQRFLKAGERKQTISANSDTLRNPTSFDSRPMIRAYGTGNFTINGTKITINSANQYTDIDCDTQEAFKGTTNCNGNITLNNNRFPTLGPGSNSISKSGITSIEITPRWWII